jgi:hypothetical protein
MEIEKPELKIARSFVNLIDTFSAALQHDSVSCLLASCRDLMRAESAYLYEPDPTGAMVCAGATLTDLFKSEAEIKALAQKVRLTCQSNFLNVDECTLVALPMCVEGQDCRVVVLLGSPKGVDDLRSRIPLVQAYLGAAARLLSQCNQLEQSRLLALQLQGALESRVVIEQAKGILAERNRQDLAAAFEELRCKSRNGGVPISEIARSVIQFGQASLLRQNQSSL